MKVGKLDGFDKGFRVNSIFLKALGKKPNRLENLQYFLLQCEA
jgi:hypothetical protein